MFEFNSKIKGGSFIEDGELKLRALTKEQKLKLVREKDNKFDNNAIAVYNNEIKLGYIPKETAVKLVKDVEDDRVSCYVSEVTGGTVDKKNVGCNILIKVDRLDDKQK